MTWPNWDAVYASSHRCLPLLFDVVCLQVGVSDDAQKQVGPCKYLGCLGPWLLSMSGSLSHGMWCFGCKRGGLPVVG